ncbi:MAG: glycerol-3-phosphate dehydrogenase/oxidase [Planctomycetia bacterium]
MAAGSHQEANDGASRIPSERPTVVVLGAGINGAAVARELALSAVSVVVIEADDIAAGTTAWSTRLIHGGLRYLEHGDVGLVRESLIERERLARAAPHLVRRLAFYVPVRGRWGGLWAAAARLLGWESLAKRLRGSHGRGAWTLGIGLTIYDLLSIGSRWPRHRIVWAGGPRMPRVDPRAYPCAAIYADGQATFPERLAVEMLVDAERIAGAGGSRLAIHTKSHARLLPDGTVVVSDAASGETTVALRPRAIINATGPWVDRTCHDLLPADSAPLVGGTKGSHLLIRSQELRAAIGEHGIYSEADDGRPVFVLPFEHGLVLVGTTDIPYSGDPAAARADAGEIDYLLAVARKIFPQVAFDRGDVQQHYSGVRPLPASDTSRRGAPAAITRRHMLVGHQGAPLPTWSIIGGKLTTCRSLAESVAATVLPAVGMAVTETSRVRPLPGAWPIEGAEPPASLVEETASAAIAAGVPLHAARDVASRLIDIFGIRAVAACREPAPDGWRGAAMIADVGLPTSAVWFTVRHEWARSIADVVERRLMLVFDPRLSRRSLATIAEALDACGIPHLHGREAAVEAYAMRLHDAFGKQLITTETTP